MQLAVFVFYCLQMPSSIGHVHALNQWQPSYKTTPFILAYCRDHFQGKIKVLTAKCFMQLLATSMLHGVRGVNDWSPHGRL